MLISDYFLAPMAFKRVVIDENGIRLGKTERVLARSEPCPPTPTIIIFFVSIRLLLLIGNRVELTKLFANAATEA